MDTVKATINDGALFFRLYRTLEQEDRLKVWPYSDWRLLNVCDNRTDLDEIISKVDESDIEPLTLEWPQYRDLDEYIYAMAYFYSGKWDIKLNYNSKIAKINAEPEFVYIELPWKPGVFMFSDIRMAPASIAKGAYYTNDNDLPKMVMGRLSGGMFSEKPLAFWADVRYADITTIFGLRCTNWAFDNDWFKERFHRTPEYPSDEELAFMKGKFRDLQRLSKSLQLMLRAGCSIYSWNTDDKEVAIASDTANEDEDD